MVIVSATPFPIMLTACTLETYKPVAISSRVNSVLVIKLASVLPVVFCETMYPVTGGLEEGGGG